MPPIKIAVQLRSVPLEFKKAVPAVARLGAGGVEIDARGEINPRDMSQTAVRSIRKLLDDNGLHVPALEFRTRRGYNVADDLTRRVEATKAAMKLAHSLGAPVVVNQLGRVPEDATSAEWQLMIEALADLGAYGHRVGALLAAETGSESGADLRRLLDALPPAAIAVAFNPGNLLMHGFAPLETIEALGSDILYVRAKDGVRDRSKGRGMEVTLGRGSADFPALLGALEERGYRGFFAVESVSEREPLAELALAVEYLRNL